MSESRSSSPRTTTAVTPVKHDDDKVATYDTAPDATDGPFGVLATLDSELRMWKTQWQAVQKRNEELQEQLLSAHGLESLQKQAEKEARNRTLPDEVQLSFSPDQLKSLAQDYKYTCTSASGGVLVQLERKRKREEADPLSKVAKQAVRGVGKGDLGLVLWGPHAGARVKVLSVDKGSGQLVVQCKKAHTADDDADGNKGDKWTTQTVTHLQAAQVGHYAGACSESWSD